MINIKKTDINTVPYEYIKKAPVFNDVDFLFVVKKTEKVSLVTYLITDNMSSNEPLKWHLRELATQAHGEVMSLRNLNFEHGTDVHNKLCELSGVVMSLLAHYEIALHTRYISGMNYEILKDELLKLYDLVDVYVQQKQAGGSTEIEQDIFEVDMGSKRRQTSKGHIKSVLKKDNFDIEKKSNDFYKKESTKKVKPQFSVSKKISRGNSVIKKGRREDILRIIKDKGNVSIKDISKLITNCSEKTIQRELLSLVKDSVIKKEGERRWSTYSLVS